MGLFILKGAAGIYQRCQLSGFEVSNLAVQGDDAFPALIDLEVADPEGLGFTREEEETTMRQWRSTLSIVKTDDDLLSSVTFEDRRVLEKHARKPGAA